MKLRHPYYLLKPYLPWRLRMAMRRWIAKRTLATSGAIWPIKPGSEKPPKDWPGWPDGKKFAVILTHDVEGPQGLERVRALAELEMKLGFRSSFNFIPEGDYRVAEELRDWLTGHGFEVGVHDLYHNGRLYSSEEAFRAHARKINYYLKEWKAVGFRSGFMHHNLDWIHQLNIQYDASTFDTDPFEPQPDGVNTIFPFWVPRSEDPGWKTEDGRQRRDPSSVLGPPSSVLPQAGYVELPYTLPQDSTLFLLFDEQNDAIWRKKVDWLAEKGGMVLINVHPDYMNFDGKLRGGTEYPAARYEEFLKYLSQKFANQFWQTKPGMVADWYQASCRTAPSLATEPNAPRAIFRDKKAAVLLYSYYPSDPRPRREAEALASAGMEVDLICLRQKPDDPACETINGVNVSRLPLRRRRDGKLTYLWQYGYFVALCATTLLYRSLRKRYDLVHVHNMPDVLVFSALVPKLRGAKLILDLHDPMPELMRTIFDLPEDSFVVRLLKRLEKLSIRFADQVITVNQACKRIFASRSCPPEKVLVVMNAPDEKIFPFCNEQFSHTPGNGKPFVVMYHGSIVERHGLDLAVQALRIVREKFANAELRVYGQRTAFLDGVMDSIQGQSLRDAVRYFGAQSLEQIVKAIEECDVGIIPNRRSVFTEINTPTRIFEYLACGRPVIAPRVPGITDYFGKQDLVFFKLGDAEDLARKIEGVYLHPSQALETMKRGQEVYLRHSWSQEQLGFMNRVQELLRFG